MAKEEKIKLEQEDTTKKEQEVKAVEEEFDLTEAAPEAKDASTEGATEGAVKTDKPSIIDSEAALKAEEKTWQQLGLSEYEGKTRNEIAKITQQRKRETDYRNQLYGEQANEIGELRKKLKGIDEAKISKEDKQDLLDTISDMTEGQVTDFNVLWDKNPVKALLKYSNPHIKQLIQQEIKASFTGDMGKQFQETVSLQTEQAKIESFFNSNPDADTYRKLMELLDGPANLGEQNRPVEELCELAKLGVYAVGVEPDPLYTPVYALLKRHPNMTFVEAKSIAAAQGAAETNADTLKDKAIKDIKKIDAVNLSTSGKGKSSASGEIVSVEDEFQLNG